MYPFHYLQRMKASVAVLTTSLLLCMSCGDSAAPVLLEPDEQIIGRSGDDAQVRLLTTSHRLLVVDVRGRSRLPTMRQTAIAFESGDEPWGLATSPDGRLWTLIGTNRLAEIRDDGRIAERVSTVNSTGRRNTSMMRCCDAETETEKVRPGGSTCDAFAWPAAGSGA